jgi:nicotinamidase/pyrazinamidase
MRLEGIFAKHKSGALIVVGMQNDYMPGGPVGVPESDMIVDKINHYTAFFGSHNFPVFYSRDWHPENTTHFENGWPVHCVQNTLGAQFCPALTMIEDAIIISKGIRNDYKSYSIFHGLIQDGIEVSIMLTVMGVDELYIAGIPTEYCIKHSVIHALRRRYRVCLLTDAVKGFEQESAREAIDEMEQSGAMLLGEQSVKRKLVEKER